MPNSLEAKERCFFVRPTEHGIYVDDKDTGRRFFQTRAGGWFWVGGPDFPFGEHVRLTGETAERLSSLVETARAGGAEF